MPDDNGTDKKLDFTGASYDEFRRLKRTIQAWTASTAVDKTKQGPRLLLHLKDAAWEAAEELSVDDLSKETGVETLLKLLDARFAPTAQNEIAKACMAVRSPKSYCFVSPHPRSD